MFILKTAFWLTIIILLLPTGADQQARVYGTAEATVQDIRAFCVRNPNVCETSRQAFDTFAEKAQFGARMLVDLVKDHAPDHTASIGPARGGGSLGGGLGRASRNTLTDDDLEPVWQGPAHRSGT